MSSTSATRQRRFWLTTSFLAPIVSLGISGAQAQQTAVRAIAADRDHLAHRPEPDARKTDLR